MRICLDTTPRWHNTLYYIIPRRLTLKNNPPIYKWLWFIIGTNKGGK